MKKKLLRIFSFLFFLSYSIHGLSQSNFRADSIYFQNQAKMYQVWLEKSGLGELIVVEKLDIQKDKLKLNLVAKPDKVRDFWPYWKNWRADFANSNPISLEQKLFYKLHHMLDVSQSQVELDIFDQRPRFCHRLIIYFANGQVQSSKQSCRAKERNIEVSPASFYGLKEISYQEIQKRFHRMAVFNAILKYSEQKYGNSKCELRFPDITVLEQGEVLRFVITDLCKEVLVDESDPWICNVLKRFGHQCNWIKREKLEFLITYQTIPSGIKIGVQIDGKYGSGYYNNVKRGGYHLMDVDFDDYLEDYADKMKNEFKKLLLEL